MNQIETKKILFFDQTLSKVDPKSPMQLRTRFFRKYFPKYLRNFDLQTKINSVEAKVKRAKIFRNYKDSTTPPCYKPLELRLLMQNKIKFIKSLGGNAQYPIDLINKIQLFTNLRSIQVSRSLDYKYWYQKTEFKDLIKALEKAKRLRNAKSLEFNQLHNYHSTLLQTINASPRVLSSFKTLSLSPGYAGSEDGRALDIIKDCKNLLKYVTSLRLPNLRYPRAFQNFQRLENSCPNLKSLCFEFCCREIFYNSDKADRYSCECFPVDINYLSTIKTFHNLRSLDLRIADTFTFINDFTAPPSLQNLLLNFKECITKEILIRIDPSFNRQNSEQILMFFETNPTILKFYQVFEHLHELQTLEMLCSSHVTPEEYQYYNYLSQGVLQSIPSTQLKKLNFAEGGFHWGLNKLYKFPLEDFYFYQLLQSCHTFRQSLEALEISHTEVIFSNFNMLSFLNTFTSLSTFIFTGTFDKKDHSNSGIYLFLKNVIASGASLKTLKLNTFVHGTRESLFSLLQQLNQLEKPENLTIKLQIKFYDDKNLEKLRADLFEVLQQEYSRLKGVDLNIFMNDTKQTKEFLKVYGEKFDNFKKFPSSHSFRDSY